MNSDLYTDLIGKTLVQLTQSTHSPQRTTVLDGILALESVDEHRVGFFLLEDTAHKYVHTVLQLPEKTAVEWWFASPVTFHEFHRDIISFLETYLQSEPSYCFGGGYIEVTPQNTIRCFSSSTQYGRADHDIASKRFSQLYLNLG